MIKFLSVILFIIFSIESSFAQKNNIKSSKGNVNQNSINNRKLIQIKNKEINFRNDIDSNLVYTKIVMNNEKVINYNKQRDIRLCGNGKRVEDYNLRLITANIYNSLHRDKQAITELLPYLNGGEFVQSHEAEDSLLKYLSKYFTIEELRYLYSEAFKNYKINRPQSRNSDELFCYIVFLGTKIPISQWSIYVYKTPNKMQDELINKFYRQTYFYKLLNTN
jgi:hypothetical protein